MVPVIHKEARTSGCDISSFFFFKCHHVEHLVEKDTKITQLNIYSAQSREIVATIISALC